MRRGRVSAQLPVSLPPTVVTRARAKALELRFIDLPEELVLRTLGILSPVALCKLRRVCRDFRKFASRGIALLPRPVVLGGEKKFTCSWNMQVFRNSMRQLCWKTMQWEAPPSMAVERRQPSVAALDDGTLVVIGGDRLRGQSCWSQRSWTAEVLHPDAAAWRLLPVPPIARPDGAAAALPGRRVLHCGGREISPTRCDPTNDAFVLELDALEGPTWSAVAPMEDKRCNHAAMCLPSGHVVVVGGKGAGWCPTVAEIFDPETNTWLCGEDDGCWARM